MFFFSSRRRHTRSYGDWSSDVCSSDLVTRRLPASEHAGPVAKRCSGGCITSTPCALGERDLISAEHSGLSLPLPPLLKTDFYNPALRPYQPTRVRACKRHSPVVREPC